MASGNWIQDFAQDLHYAARTLIKSPGFATVAILTLALGIGANTAIFSFVNAVLLKPLPFRAPEKIVALGMTEAAPETYPLTGEDYLDWKTQNSTFDEMSLYSWQSRYNVGVAEGETEGADVVRTEANFFGLLGVPAQIGRTFAKGEDQNGGSHVALLSNGFWKKQFAGKPDVLGKPVVLNGEPYTVIGVMPAWYRLPSRSDIWVPLDMAKDKLGPRGSHSWRGIGRVKATATIAQARADLRTIAERLEKQFPDSNHAVDAVVTPMRENLVGNFQSQLWIMFGAVALVLLIACANVANLLLARATGRRREVAVRSALGAGRGRLVRQLLTESLLLSLTGGIVGLAIAFGGVAVLRSSLPVSTPLANPIEVGMLPLLFTFATCVITGVLFGLAPALQSAGVSSAEALRSKVSIGGGIRGGHWLRDGLVAAEIALSLALLIGAGLLLRTFANLRATDVGVRGEKVLTAAVRLPQNKYKTMDDGRVFFAELLQRLQNAPGLNAAAITTKLPMLGGSNGYIQIPGEQDESMTGPLVENTGISGEYFRVMGIPLLAGRDLSAADHEMVAKFMREIISMKDPKEAEQAAAKYTLPVVINATMAKTFWPKKDAVGKVFKAYGMFHVVGVVGDVKQQELRSPAMPEAYYPLEWEIAEPNYPVSVVVQSAGAPEGAAGTVREALRSIDGTLALMSVRTMPEILSEAMNDTRYETWLLGGAALLALILAAVGTYGVMSYVVGQRTNEIGIRMALGAGQGQIVGMVLRQAGVLVGIGIVIGLAGAAGGARLMQGLLVGVKPFDMATYGSVAALLMLVALAACYLPVRRAMNVDPMVALRDE